MSGIRNSTLARQDSTSVRTPPSVTKTTRAAAAIPSDDPLVDAMERARGGMPHLLTPQAVAEVLGLTERTLERWRITGEGPRYIKLSRSTVRYLPEDLATFVADRIRANTAQ